MNGNSKRTIVPCPNCIGGRMFSEGDGELVCINCGYRKKSLVPVLVRGAYNQGVAYDRHPGIANRG